MDENYLDINRNSWNERTERHVDSEFYDMPSFLSGKSSINEIETPLLGDVKDKSLLHLQCHFGQDTLSLARLGAKVTGIDLSDKAIAKAKEINDQIGTDAKFINCDVYSTPEKIQNKFDMVFTSYGTIGWLPDIKKWAAVVSGMLIQGGTFVMADFHPTVWMFDDDFTEVKYKYSNDAPIIEIIEGSYAGSNDYVIKNISWNHGIGEILTALIESGLQIDVFQEHHYSPYDCFSGVKEIAPKKFIIEKMGDKLPMVYAIKATKK